MASKELAQAAVMAAVRVPWLLGIWDRFRTADLGQHLSAALIAAGCAMYLYTPPLVSFGMALAWALLLAGVVISKKQMPGKVVLVSASVIVGSSLLAVLLADKEWLPQTIVLAILTLVVAPLVFVRNDYIFRYLTPVWLLHAGLCIYQWASDGPSRVTGLSQNANIASAFLLLGCVYLINGHKRARWLMLPLLAALPYTGSRWVAVVAAVVIMSLYASKVVSWKYIAIGMAVTVILVVSAGWQDIYAVMVRPSSIVPSLTAHAVGLEFPHQPDLPPSWIPRGFYDSGIHSTAWRMAHETGILSAIAWLGATAWALWKRPRYGTQWWMLLTVFLVSVLYYHFWVGALGAYWWLLVRPTSAPSPSDSPST